MKIISKFKDYYDHEINYFGRDETRILDRRNDKNVFVPDPNMGYELLFAICGQLYPIIKKKGIIYNQFSDKSGLNEDDKRFLSDKALFVSETKVNEILRKPIVAFWSPYYKDDAYLINKSYFIPILSNYGIASLIPSREIYQSIYDFLGWLKDHPEIPNKQTNKEKILSHGFDVKNSFRPKIKR